MVCHHYGSRHDDLGDQYNHLFQRISRNVRLFDRERHHGELRHSLHVPSCSINRICDRFDLRRQRGTRLHATLLPDRGRRERGYDGQGWYNIGSVATSSSLGVFGRASGTGFRLTSYNVDGGSNTILTTTSTVQVSVTMNARAHRHLHQDRSVPGLPGYRGHNSAELHNRAYARERQVLVRLWDRGHADSKRRMGEKLGHRVQTEVLFDKQRLERAGCIRQAPVTVVSTFLDKLA